MKPKTRKKAAWRVAAAAVTALSLLAAPMAAMADDGGDPVEDPERFTIGGIPVQTYLGSPVTIAPDSITVKAVVDDDLEGEELADAVKQADIDLENDKENFTYLYGNNTGPGTATLRVATNVRGEAETTFRIVENRFASGVLTPGSIKIYDAAGNEVPKSATNGYVEPAAPDADGSYYYKGTGSYEGSVLRVPKEYVKQGAGSPSTMIAKADGTASASLGSSGKETYSFPAVSLTDSATGEPMATDDCDMVKEILERGKPCVRVYQGNGSYASCYAVACTYISTPYIYGAACNDSGYVLEPGDDGAGADGTVMMMEMNVKDGVMDPDPDAGDNMPKAVFVQNSAAEIPAINVYGSDGKLLEEGAEDGYYIDYKGTNTAPGEATAYIYGKGKYASSTPIMKKFLIYRKYYANIPDRLTDAAGDIKEQAYPCTDEGRTAKLGTDKYSLTFYAAGTTGAGDKVDAPQPGAQYRLVMEGLGDYKGNYDEKFVTYVTDGIESVSADPAFTDEPETKDEMDDKLKPTGRKMLTGTSLAKLRVTGASGAAVPETGFAAYLAKVSEASFTVSINGIGGYATESLEAELPIVRQLYCVSENGGYEPVQQFTDGSHVELTVTDADGNIVGVQDADGTQWDRPKGEAGRKRIDNQRFIISETDVEHTSVNVSIIGWGKYANSEQVNFTVDTVYLSPMGSLEEIPDYEYTGRAIEPVPVVRSTDGGVISRTANDGDGEVERYTVSYRDNTGPGLATVTATGAPGSFYEGQEASGTFRIYRTFTVDPIPDQQRTGGTIVPEVTARGELGILEAGRDYAVAAAGPNIGPGTGTALVTGLGEYEGYSVSAAFRITDGDMELKRVAYAATNGTIPDQKYTGSAIEPEVIVTSSSGAFVDSSNYELKYTNNTEKGVATVTAYAKGGLYTGSASAKFNITEDGAPDPAGLAKMKAISPIADQYYTGKPAEPAVEVLDGNGAVVPPTQYSVAYSNNTAPGSRTASVRVTGKGSHSGESLSAAFSIVRRTGKISHISSIPDYPYTGQPAEPEFIVYATDGLPVGPLDYEAAYSPAGAKDLGTEVTVTVTGKEGFAGSGASGKFRIVAASITKVMTRSAKYNYKDGKPVEPLPAVYDQAGHVMDRNAYDLSYEDNLEIGTAKVHAAAKAGANGYTGSGYGIFEIVESGGTDVDEENRSISGNSGGGDGWDTKWPDPGTGGGSGTTGDVSGTRGTGKDPSGSGYGTDNGDGIHTPGVKVGLDANEGSFMNGREVIIITADSRGRLTVPEPTRSGWTLHSWHFPDGEEFDNATTPVTSPTILTAWWKNNATGEIDSSSTPRALLDGGNGDVSIIEDASSESFDPGIPYREGYTFLGWYYPDGTKYQPGDRIDATTVLVARWQKNEDTSAADDDPSQYEQRDTVVVAFDANEGSFSDGTDVKVTTAKKGSKFSGQTATRAGWTFLGWYGPDGTQYTQSATITEDVFVTAWWKDPETGATDSSSPVKVAVDEGNGSQYVLAVDSAGHIYPKDPVREGYDFKGWMYPNGTTFLTSHTIARSTVIAARWKKQKTVLYSTLEYVVHEANGIRLADGSVMPMDGKVEAANSTILAGKSYTLSPGFSGASYSSEDGVSVTKGGKINIKTAGTYRITAEGGGQRKDFTINVEDIQMSDRTITGASGTLTEPIATGNKYMVPTAYHSSNEAVATVDAKGVITLRKKGTSRISIYFGAKKLTSTVRVR